MKRALIFSTAYLPLVGGAEVALKELTDRLTDWEFDLIAAAIVPGLAKEERLGRVRVFRIGFGAPLDKLFLPIAAWRKAESLHRQKPYDATWVMMASYAAFGAEIFKRRHPEVPMLLTLQEGDPPAHIARRTRAVKSWFRNIFRQADALQPISRFLMDWGRSQGFSGTLAEIIPNGVELERFSIRLSDEERRSLRARHGFSDGDAVVVTTSRLVPKNGVDLIVEAMAGLPERVKLLIGGTGPQEAELRSSADRLGVSKRIVFAGLIAQADLPAFLRAGDLFCRPSRSEGLGISFIEAMAAGLPVVATGVGGIPDIIQDGRNGLLVEAESAAAVAVGLRKLVEHPELAARLAHAGLESSKNYDWDDISRRFSDLLERMDAEKSH